MPKNVTKSAVRNFLLAFGALDESIFSLLLPGGPSYTYLRFVLWSSDHPETTQNLGGRKICWEGGVFYRSLDQMYLSTNPPCGFGWIDGHVTSRNQGLCSNDQGRQRRETLATRLIFPSFPKLRARRRGLGYFSPPSSPSATFGSPNWGKRETLISVLLPNSEKL